MKRRMVAVLSVCVIVSGVIIVARSRPAPRPAHAVAPAAGNPFERPAVMRLSRPQPRPQNYVGSDACARCHEEIFVQYRKTDMGRSMAAIQQATVIEDYESKKVVGLAEKRGYQARREGNTFTHHEITYDVNDEPLFDLGQPIRFSVGSGKRGRAYLIERKGRFYQSPLGWYSQSKRWDLSPGYVPGRHPRFSREVGDGCLYCHASASTRQTTSVAETGDAETSDTEMGDTAGAEQNADHHGSAVSLFEAAIGCERCHGPGEAHIEHHSGEIDQQDIADPIVNPANLAPKQRDAICFQCHLLGRSVIPRYGRDFYDFRPGDSLEDVFVVLSQKSDTQVRETVRAVSQVEQMRASKCYQASAGKMGCVTCHDTHTVLAAEDRDSHYRNRCNQCHRDDDHGCSVALETRLRSPARNACTHCHMPGLPTDAVPHTAMTDHRILRNTVQEKTIKQPAAEKTGRPALRVFDDADQRLPKAEIDRARGIALMTDAWNRHDRYLASQALATLLKALEFSTLPISARVSQIDDVMLLEELGAAYFILQDFTAAKSCWKRVLELEPQNETALLGIANVAVESSDIDTYAACLERLRKISPAMPAVLEMRVKLQTYKKDLPKGAEEAERVLKIDPTMVSLRVWLVDIYRRLGEDKKADRHRRLLEKMGVGKTKKR